MTQNQYAKILVMSDTHGNQLLLRQAFNNETGLSHVIHLGDNWEDLEQNPDLLEGVQLLQVPGIYHPFYHKKLVPVVLNATVCGWKLLLVHCLDDAQNQLDTGDVIMFGHTHLPRLQVVNHKMYLNPGHLKRDSDRGASAGYAILELTNQQLTATVKTLAGQVLFSSTMEHECCLG